MPYVYAVCVRLMCTSYVYANRGSYARALCSPDARGDEKGTYLLKKILS